MFNSYCPFIVSSEREMYTSVLTQHATNLYNKQISKLNVCVHKTLLATSGNSKHQYAFPSLFYWRAVLIWAFDCRLNYGSFDRTLAACIPATLPGQRETFNLLDSVWPNSMAEYHRVFHTPFTLSAVFIF